MRHQIEPAIVRIINQAGTPIGAGLLAGEGRILTCAHVIREALGLPENPQEPPDAAIQLDFPLVDGATPLSGHVFLWRPDLDIAGLAVDGALPETARSLSLVDAADFWGHSFRAYGFPKGREDGVWAGGEIRGPQAQGWLQIDTGSSGYHVEPGFSGGPVWDDVLGGVVGLVTRSDTKAGVRAAYVIPARLLLKAWPELARICRPPSPYRGLKAFREVDAANFYGRDTYTDRLVQEVDQNGLLAVIGPSGSGKSSVVFAGLAPVLRRDGSWLILDFRPGRDPFRSLATALLPYLEPGMSEVDRLVETGKLAVALEAGDLELAGILARLLALDGTAERVLLIADQFEELYTLGDDPERRRRFLDVLLALEANGPPTAPSTLCLTLRADFMGQALSYRLFADRLQDHDIKLGPMNREELRTAIVKPAAALEADLEPGLVDRILDDVGQEPGNLPLLEFALTLLWEEQQLGRLTHQAYNSIGQVQGALARHAEAVFARLSSVEQDVARSVFIQLIQPGAGTADTRRQATREEVGDSNWTLVQQLAGERLLTTGGDEQGRETVEVAHEALIQHWGRLQGWMAEDRTFRKWQQRLRAAMAMWQASGQDDGALLRGAPLAEAEAWLAERGEQLPPGERAYIQAGVDTREAQARDEEARRQNELAMAQAVAETERQRAEEQAQAGQGLRRRSLLALAVAALAVLAAVGAVYFWNRAESDRRVAEARALAARSLEIMDRDPDQGLLLAYQAAQKHAARAEPVSNEAYGALHTALARLGQPLAVLKGHTLWMNSAAFSPDGQRIVTASDDNTPRLWDGDGGPLAVLEGHTRAVYSAAFSPDGQRIVTASFDGTARLWDGDGQPLAVLAGHTGPVFSAAYSPDGQRIVTASGDNTARLWDGDGGPLAVLKGHTGPVYSATFSPDGTRIVTASFEGTARLWDGDGGPLAVLVGHINSVDSAAFSPDGQRIVTISGDNTARLWGGDGQPLTVLAGHVNSVTSAAYSSDGQRIVTASYDNTARLWDGDGEPLAVLEGHTRAVSSAAFSPDGQRIVTASDDNTARLWDSDGGPLAVLRGHTGPVYSVAFSPDGQRIVTTSYDNTARLWDGGGQPLAVLEGHTGPVNSATFSPDGTRILTTSSNDFIARGVNRIVSSGNTIISIDTTARLWDSDGRLLAVLEGHNSGVLSAAFSPDGQRIVTASWDGTARLWTSDGQPLAVLAGHTDPVWSAAFSPDGQRIVTASGDGTARLWQTYADVESMMAEAEQVLVRLLPYEECVVELGEELCREPESAASP